MFLVAVSTGHDAKQSSGGAAAAAAPYMAPQTRTMLDSQTTSPPASGFLAPMPADTGIPKYPRL
jgi:hypothetical protein